MSFNNNEPRRSKWDPTPLLWELSERPDRWGVVATSSPTKTRPEAMAQLESRRQVLRRAGLEVTGRWDRETGIGCLYAMMPESQLERFLEKSPVRLMVQEWVDAPPPSYYDENNKYRIFTDEEMEQIVEELAGHPARVFELATYTPTGGRREIVGVANILRRRLGKRGVSISSKLNPESGEVTIYGIYEGKRLKSQAEAASSRK